MADEDTGDTGFDVDAGVATIAADLGFTERDDDASDGAADDGAEKVAEAVADADDKPAEGEAEVEKDGEEAEGDEKQDDGTEKVVQLRQPPKSWAKEQHEVWTKLDPKAQDYIEQRERQMLDGIDQYKGDATYGKTLREVLTPYKPIIAAAGLDEAKAVQYLMNAHYRLTSGTPEQRLSAYQLLGKNLGLVKAEAAEHGNELDPAVRELQSRQERLESHLEARRQADETARREQVLTEVQAFASDKEKHPYFDEVADDIARLIGAGYDLADAYEKAVYVNPVTRQREIARLQTEADKARKAKAARETEAAKRATAANVRGRETRKAPTELKGSMDDTLRETLSKIKDRTH